MARKTKIKIFHTRRGYFFGYGADQEQAMLRAIMGESPEYVGEAVLRDYELRIQNLEEVTAEEANPREILRRTWGDSFRSYVIVPRKGAQVHGAVFRITIKDRHKIDEWELVREGWYRRAFIKVQLQGSGKKLRAETQVLNAGQHAKATAGSHARHWLMPKTRLLSIARLMRNKQSGDT
jgi:hypothetical protein